VSVAALPLTAQQGTEQVEENTWHPASLHPEHSGMEDAMLSLAVLPWDQHRDRTTGADRVSFTT